MDTLVVNHVDTVRMPAKKSSVAGAHRSRAAIPSLVNGDTLESAEFIRRYEAMPELKKAELIKGVVHIMASPVRYQKHAKPDGTMHGLLWFYAAATSGVEFAPNATVKLDSENTFQPDGLMRKTVEKGGGSYVDPDDYVVGVPELIVEISASSAAIDSRDKKDVCREKGVPEYINWLTESAEFKWWHLKDGDYQLIPVDADGIARSRVFPGFWLDVNALLSGDLAGLMAALQRGIRSAEHEAFVAV